jgi:hypothetical protein
MKCEHVRDLLSPYVDGMASEKENKIICSHLEICPQCRQELEHLRSLCLALHNLSAPEVPERFTEDLRRRLADEKTILFSPKKLKQPKKQGWIAAGVAGIALAAGIYASSVLPIAPMVATWQDKQNKANENKPAVAINEIINRIYNGKDEDKSVDVAQAPEGTPNKAAEVNKDNPAGAPAKVSDKSVTETKQPGEVDTRTVTPKLADVFSTRLNVADARESLNEVVQLAQNNGWGYEYTDVAHALTGANNANGLAIKVHKNEVDNVINALGGVGKASAPMHNRVELTEQYTELENQLTTLQEKKQSLQQAESPDQAKINEIEQQIQDNLKQKAALDKELSLVTVNVYFVEDINP